MVVVNINASKMERKLSVNVLRVTSSTEMRKTAIKVSTDVVRDLQKDDLFSSTLNDLQKKDGLLSFFLLPIFKYFYLFNITT